MPTTPTHKSAGGNPDMKTSTLLYAIIKQLDCKGVDWNKIAEDLEISNANAARMRWMRLRQQMERPTSMQDNAAGTPSKGNAEQPKSGGKVKQGKAEDRADMSTGSSPIKAEYLDDTMEA